MAHLMSDGASAIKVPAGSDLEKAIANASSVSEIQSLLHEAARAQKLIEPDPFDTDGKNWFGYRPVEHPAVANAPHVKVLRINGVAHTIQADTEEALVAAELAKMRELFGGQPTPEQQTRRDSQGRFVAQPTQAELEAEVARVAAIDPAAAPETEIVRKALEAQGIDINALKEFSVTKQNERFTQSWTDAAVAFGKSHPDWVGGEENKNILAQILTENKLTEAEDKAAALEAAYNFAVENKMLVEPADQVEARQIAEAQTPDQLAEVLRRRGHLAPLGSNLWGR
jgi:hypothetical protein